MTVSRALKVGQVVGVHGVRGAVKVRLDNPESAVFEHVERVWISASEDEVAAAGSARAVTRVSPIPGTDRVRLWLEGLDSREAANALRGHALLVDRDALPALEEDEYYLADLVGARVIRAGDDASRSLGEIINVTTNGEQELLEVAWTRTSGADATWLLPAIPEYVVDVSETAVFVDLPADFLPTELDDDGS